MLELKRKAKTPASQEGVVETTAPTPVDTLLMQLLAQRHAGLVEVYKRDKELSE